MPHTGVIQAQGLSSVLLTYCNLLNGAAGLYLGGKVCGFLQKHMGRSRALAVFYGFGILSMVLLRNFEPAVMLLLCALATGLLDGGGTPLATDIYLDTKGIAGEIDEALALTLFSLIGFAVMAVAPIVFELCIRSSAALYITCAVLVLLCIPIALKSNNKDIDIKGGKA